MASIFGHWLVAGSLKFAFLPNAKNSKLWILSYTCSILPDMDIIMFAFGFGYSHMFGHRGFTHSLTFAFIVGISVTIVFFRQISSSSKQFWGLSFFFFLITTSHGILDAMTNGGLGIAFFAPFDNSRYFLPFRPIQVSPIDIVSFFSAWGQRVLISEIIWVGLPCMVLVSISMLFRLLKKPKHENM